MNLRITLVALSAAIASAAFAQTSLTVDGRSNIYGAGSNSTPAPGGGDGGTVAPMVSIASGTSFLTFSASGSIGYANGQDNNGGPDGTTNFASQTAISAYNGLSGVTAPRAGFLLGVFLDDASPIGQTAPSAFSYTSSSDLMRTEYSPSLRQVFFIGDGLTGLATGTGGLQQFNVPTGATRLYLGFADGFAFSGQPGYYGDNGGRFQVTVNPSVQATPEPVSMSVLACGAVAALRRRRRH